MDGACLCCDFFRDWAEEYCPWVYRHLVDETLGNVYLSSALTIAYQETVIKLKESWILCLLLWEEMVDFKETKNGAKFFCVFNNMCQRLILHSVSGFNDYNQPIVLLSSMDIFVDLATTVFPRLCEYFCSLRNVEGSRHRSDEKRYLSQKSHVLLQLLPPKRVSDFYSLKWWGLIQGIG